MAWITSRTIVILCAVAIAKASIPSTTCPQQCRCDKRKNVFCQGKNLTYVPLGIPKDTQSLHLQDNKISNSQEMEDILSELINLKRINLSNNTLTAFPRNLPKSLANINVKLNKIRYIATDVFEGLSSLETLYLDSNFLTEKGMLSTSFQGANNLKHLTLTSNLLTEVPIGIPYSVTMLRLNKNKISTVSRESLSSLSDLIDLDLRDNQLMLESFEENAFDNLESLEILDLGFNNLQNIPVELPRNIRSLIMPSNLVEYVFASKTSEHGPVKYLTNLEKLDLSYNRLRSVESGAFSGLVKLSQVILHNNPWQCDCYLIYLKNWLSSSGLVVNYESNMKCATPQEIEDVTLDSLDVESMLCFPDQKPNIALSYSSPDNIEMSWSIHDGTSPPYAGYRVMFGELKCGNCSEYPFEDDTWKKNNHAAALVISYQIIPVEESSTNGDFVSVNLPSANDDGSYMACLLNSFDAAQLITAKSCKFVRRSVATTPTDGSPNNLESNNVPIWIMAVVLSVIVVILAIIIALVVKKKLHMKSKLKRATTTNGGSYYDPFTHYLRPEPFRANTSNVGATNITQYRPENERLMSRTSDATKEFDVTLMIRPDPNNPNLLRTHHGGSPETCVESCCSDFQNATISTNNTRTATESMGSEIAEIDGNSISRDDCSLPYSTNSKYTNSDRGDEYIYHTIASNACQHEAMV